MPASARVRNHVGTTTPTDRSIHPDLFARIVMRARREKPLSIAPRFGQCWREKGSRGAGEQGSRGAGGGRVGGHTESSGSILPAELSTCRPFEMGEQAKMRARNACTTIERIFSGAPNQSVRTQRCSLGG